MTLKDAFTQNPDHECFECFLKAFLFNLQFTRDPSATHELLMVLRISLNAIVFVKSVKLTKPFHAVFIVLQINQSLPLYLQFLTPVRHLVVKRNSTDKNPLCAFMYPQILFILWYKSIIQTHELHGSNNAPFSL